MITNERQYRITRAAADKIRDTVEAPRAPVTAKRKKIDDAARAGLRRQLEELDADLKVYDGLKAAAGKKHLTGRLQDLGALAIQARIARGWTQAKLAERLGLAHQQIAEYESRAYDRASVTRMLEVLTRLGAEVKVSIDLIPIPAGLEEAIADASTRAPKRAARAK